MAINRTINFLPEYFRTTPNARFIGSTLDRLVSSAQVKRFDGYVGRQYAGGQKLPGAYIQEDTAIRTDYQLESNFVLRDQTTNNVNAAIGFKDLLNSIAGKNGIVDNWNRLLTSNAQSWKGFVDIDKIVNYSDYVWVPKNTESGNWFWNNPVIVSNTTTNLIQNFDVTRTSTSLAITSIDGPNPTLQVLRGGQYIFEIEPDTTVSNTRSSHTAIQGNDVDQVFADSNNLYLNNTSANFSGNSWLDLGISPDFSFGNSVWTIESFINFPFSASEGMIVGSWKDSDLDNSSWKLSLTAIAGNRSIQFTWIDPTTNISNSLGYNGTLDTSTWHHIAVCRSSNVLRLYINGFLVNSSNYSGLLKQQTFDLTIGADINGNLGLNGNLSNLRITKNLARYVDATYIVPTIMTNDSNTVLFLPFASTSESTSFIDVSTTSPSNIWIQSFPGTNGIIPGSSVISGRNIQGVTNNGVTSGTITFNVPTVQSNQVYLNLQTYGSSLDSINLATNLNYDQINGADYATFIQIPNIGENSTVTGHYGGIDGETNLNGKTLIFAAGQTTGWNAVLNNQKFGIWVINVVNGVIQLTFSRNWLTNYKETIIGGSVFRGTSWYKNVSGTILSVPDLTSLNSTLYLQDDSNPTRVLSINILATENLPDYPALSPVVTAAGSNQPLNGVTSIDGVALANGNRVLLFAQNDATQNGIYVVSSGTWERSSDLATSAQLQAAFVVQVIGGFAFGNAYFSHGATSNIILGQSVVSIVQVDESPILNISTDILGQAHYTSGNGVKFVNGLNVTFTSSTIPAPFNDTTQSWIVEGVGKSIVLVPNNYIQIPSQFLLQNSPADYITINRASIDGNPWSTYNQWIHNDVLNATINYLSQQLVTIISPTFVRAVRPIVEFYSGLQLFNFGIIYLSPIDLVDTFTPDAFDNVQGKSSYTVDGVVLTENTRIIFNADQDSNIRKTIYKIHFITDDNGNSVITLIASDSATSGSGVYVLGGTKNIGQNLVWNTVTNTWDFSSQIKLTVNQAPLFDLFDSNGNSYSNSNIYPSSTFSGSKLFGYAIGTGNVDSILGFPLEYGNIGNLGDIIFNNYYTTDTFFYQPSTQNFVTSFPVFSALANRIDSVGVQNLYDPWEFIDSNLELYQNLIFTGQSTIVVQGVLLTKTNGLNSPHKVYVDGKQLSLTDYTVNQTTTGLVQNIVIIIKSGIVGLDSLVFVKLLSSTAISNAWYDVPVSFDQNPFGENITSFTVTDLRRHITTAASNLIQPVADDMLGYNLDDIDFIGVAGSILYHESFSLLPSLLLTQNEFDIDQALKVTASDYVTYKQKFLNIATQIANIENLPIKTAVDSIIQQLTTYSDSSMPWFTSDMFAIGGTNISTKVIDRDQLSFPIKNVYDWTQAGNKSILVYKNNIQLLRGFDYNTAIGNPTLILTNQATIGDKIDIYEISNTNGTMMPATPTKLGLSPLYVPNIYNDTTFITAKTVIRGHDGSVTTAFGDYRDNLLLELECRIFNNIKVDNQFWSDIIEERVPTSGIFRNLQSTTNNEVQPYSSVEQTEILQRMFYEWVANYQIDYTQSYYNSENSFTWNWTESTDKFNEPLNGYWKGIYQNFYDTTHPNTRPWELLNIAIKPTWWDTTYGPAPYTGQNLLMWSDLSNGIIRNPLGITRSALGLRQFGSYSVMNIIPVDESGNLLDPNASVVQQFNNSYLTNEFTFGDGAPAESTWRNSSFYPYAKLRAQILENPLFMCGSLWDLNNYKPVTGSKNFRYTNNSLAQIVNLQLNSVDLNSNGSLACVNSILNFSIEYIRKQGKSPVDLRTALNSADVNLVYDMAGFADANNITIYADQNSAEDQGSSVTIPQEDYALYLSQNLPSGVLTYSGVVITITALGYKVSGYDKFDPFFKVLPSVTQGPATNLTVGNGSYSIYKNYSTTPQTIAYNTQYPDRQSVVDFLLSYGRYLESTGFVFDTQTNQDKISWQDAIVQFVKWSYEKWSFDSNNQSLSLVLNPASSQLVINLNNGTISDLTDTDQNMLVDINRNIVDQKYLDVFRDNNQITITHQAGNVLAGLRANIVAYEHRLIVSNTTIFNDIINDPLTGLRQNRLRIVGQKTGNWDGTLNTPGFMIVTGQVDAWASDQDYLAGSLVTFKNSNYVALSDIIGNTSFQYNQFSQLNTTFVDAVLPNLSLKGDDLENVSDINYRNYISDIVTLRGNTLGYIERSWLSDLGLDIAAQTNFYRGWIKEKGTLSAITNFGRASNDSFNTAVTIYEEFAVKVGDYGATNRTGYVDVLLQQNNNNQNPIVISFTNTPDATDTHTLQVPTFSLYKKGANWTEDFVQVQGDIKANTKPFVQGGPVLPSTLITIAEERVPQFSQDDAQYLSFLNISDIVNSTNQNNILNIAKNSGLFWICNDSTRTEVNKWNIIKFIPALTTVSNISTDSSGNIILALSTDINAQINSLFGVDYIDPISGIEIQGIFNVLNYVVAPTLNSIAVITLQGPTVSLPTSTTPGTPVTGLSLYQTKSLRFANVAVIDGSIDDYVFISNTNSNDWANYELFEPYTHAVTPVGSVGSVVASTVAYDALDNLLWLGKPTDNNGSGSLLVKSVQNFTTPSGDVQPQLDVDLDSVVVARNDSTNLGYNLINLGNSRVAASALNNQVYIVALNPDELPGFAQVEQVLSTRTDQLPFTGGNFANFGKSISASSDGLWLFVGSPNQSNKCGVQIFTKKTTIACNYVATEISSTEYSLTGNVSPTSSYSLRVIITNVASEILNQLLIPELEYTITGNNVVFTSALPDDTFVNVQQIDSYYQFVTTLNGDGIENFGSSVSSNSDGTLLAIGTAVQVAGSVSLFSRVIENTYYPSGTTSVPVIAIASSDINFNVYVNGVLVPNTNYSYTNQLLTFNNPLTTSSTVEVDVNSFELLQTIVQDSSMFGSAVALNDNILLVGSAGHTGNSPTELTVNNQGSAYVYTLDRTNNYAYTLVQQITDNRAESVNFGSAIQWVTGNIFGVISSYLTGTIASDLLEINDGTEFDSESTQFYNGSGGYVQYLNLYQILSSENLIQAVKVKSIEAASNQGSIVFFDGNLQNLWVGNSVDLSNNLTLYNNETMYQGWAPQEVKTTPIEPRSISAAWLYDQTTNTKLVDLEIVDLSSGLLPSNINSEFDYISDLDPASYDYPNWLPFTTYIAGSNVIYNNNLWIANTIIMGTSMFNKNVWSLANPVANYSNLRRAQWNATQIGQKWFNTIGLKVIDAQIGLTLAEKQQYWNNFFPGTIIKVFEWISSAVPPVSYVSSDDNGFVNDINQPFVLINNVYYFWVYNKGTLTSNSQISSSSLAQSLQNINGSGIAMISPIDINAVAAWNINQYVTTNNAVLHIDYVTAYSNNNLHSEFILLSNNGEKTWLATPLYDTFIDSLCGVATNNLLIPDETLSNSQKYGITSGLQQSIFVNREDALLVYYNAINQALLSQPVASSQVKSLLVGTSPLPTGGFNQSVPDKVTLLSLDTSNLPENYRVLVTNNSDITNNGWNIVMLTANQQWVNIQNQTYDISYMYEMVDWIASGYTLSQPTFTISNVGELPSINLLVGNTVGILNNGDGNYAIYQFDSVNNLNPLYIENGSIQFSPELYNFAASQIGFDEQPFDQIRYFDDDPYQAIRLVTGILNESILIGDLASIADDAFFAILRYIIHENENLDWMFNTSFISVDYPITNLNIQGIYRADNPDLVQDFITESTPYHTRIRQFTSIYDVTDTGNLTVTDFDLPAQYDINYANNILAQTNSPIISLVRSPDGSLATDSQTLLEPIYSDWNNNHMYNLSNIVVIDGGSNYTSTPIVTVTGGGGTGWSGRAIVDPVTAKLVSVTTNTPGVNYISTPTITVSTTSDSTIAARVVGVLTNGTTRKINTTIRFDRIGYTTESYTGNVATSTALNRIAAYYQPNLNMLGNRPEILMTGLDLDDNVIGNTLYDPSYSVPTGPLSSQDDPLIGQTSLMLSMNPALIHNDGFSTNIFKFGQQSGSFDLSTQRYITVDLDNTTERNQLNLNTANLTIEFYTRFNSLTDIIYDNAQELETSTQVEMMIFDTRDNNSGTLGNSGITISKDITNNISLNIYDPTGNSTVYTPTITDGGFSENIWQYVVLERLDDRYALYLDGNKVSDFTSSDTISFTNENLTFGADALGNNAMNGYVDEFRLTLNANRYDITANSIIVPTEEFPRSEFQDPLFNEEFTKVLYGFQSLHNEASANIAFKTVNNSMIMNDISSNKKILQLFGYDNELIINDTKLTSSKASSILVGQFNMNTANLSSSTGYISASTDADYNFGIDDFAIEMWANIQSISGTVNTLLEITDAQSISDVTRWRNRLILRLNGNILNAVVLRSRWGIVVSNVNNIPSPLNSLNNMELYYNGALLPNSQYSIIGGNFVFNHMPTINDIIEIGEVIATCSAGVVTLNTDYFISLERKNNKMYIFVNGQLKSTVSATMNIPADRQNGVSDDVQLTIAPTALMIGANRSGVDKFIGEIGEVRVTNGSSRYVSIVETYDHINSLYIDNESAALTANVSGGNYINNIPVKAPEEHVALGIFDALDLLVYQSDVSNPTVPVLGFRISKSLLGQNPYEYNVTTGNVITNQIPVIWDALTPDGASVVINSQIVPSNEFIVNDHTLTLTSGNITANSNVSVFNTGNVTLSSIAANSILKLAANLSVIDTQIVLADVSTLSTPNPSASILGQLFINGEHITFLTIDRTTNTVSGLRRGVSRTSIGNLYVSGTRVIDSNSKYNLPDSARTTVWSTPGTNSAANGLGLANGNTETAIFLVNKSTILP